jgi:hypothetical protein
MERVRPITECQCIVIFNITTRPSAAQYWAPAWLIDAGKWRDPDKVVVVHIHFVAPVCTPTSDDIMGVGTSGKRIQVSRAIAS